ncbi:hypothetical protein VUR80DRAFT_5156 [Thermomyces stellatus]
MFFQAPLRCLVGLMILRQPRLRRGSSIDAGKEPDDDGVWHGRCVFTARDDEERSAVAKVKVKEAKEAIKKEGKGSNRARQDYFVPEIVPNPAVQKATIKEYKKGTPIVTIRRDLNETDVSFYLLFLCEQHCPRCLLDFAL